jgi:hypothetical protein
MSGVTQISLVEFAELQAFADSSRLFSPVTARVVDLASRLNNEGDVQDELRKKLFAKALDEMSAGFFWQTATKITTFFWSIFTKTATEKELLSQVNMEMLIFRS